MIKLQGIIRNKVPKTTGCEQVQGILLLDSLDSLNSLGDLCDAARNMSLAKEAVEVTEIPDSDDDDGICSRFQKDKVFVNDYLATLRAEVKRRKFPTLICLCPHDGCMAACLM